MVLVFYEQFYNTNNAIQKKLLQPSQSCLGLVVRH